MSTKRSAVWNYFERLERAQAKCLKCESKLCCKGSSTSALLNHLKLRHDIILNRVSNIDSESESMPSTSKPKQIEQSGLLSFVKRESLASILARCATEDGFSIQSITRSVAIRGFVECRGFKMPKSRHTVMKNIYSFFEEKKDELKKYLSKLKQNKKKFSITEDEWSDISLNKYLNITIFGEKSHVLGLVSIADNNIQCQDMDESISNLRSFNASVGNAISEARKIIKIFRRSGVKNILQHYVVAKEGKKLQLILHCKTRWNSLIPMIERFLLLKESIESGLQDLGQGFLSQENILLLDYVLHKTSRSGSKRIKQRGGYIINS
ncbi:hypothetical protein CBL_12108 [Carabus blaptoides fortunei]